MAVKRNILTVAADDGGGYAPTAGSTPAAPTLTEAQRRAMAEAEARARAGQPTMDYNEVLGILSAHNPQVSRDVVSNLSVPTATTGGNTTAQTAIPDYNEVLKSLSEENPQVSRDVVSNLGVPTVTEKPVQTGGGADAPKPQTPETAGAVEPVTPTTETAGGTTGQTPTFRTVEYTPATEPGYPGGLNRNPTAPTDPSTATAGNGGGAFDRNSAGGSVYDRMYFTDAELRGAAEARAAAEAGLTSWEAAHNYVESIRAKYGYTGGDDGSKFVSLYGGANGAKEYTPPERDPYYETNYRRILEELESYPEFQYDRDSDPLWASVAKQYRREGQRATADTLGQYAAMTGGIPSTAAVTAASQQGDYYGAQLSDRLMDVYNNAYQKYLDQYSRMMGLAGEYANGMSFAENQFIADRNFNYGQYLDNRDFNYGQYLNNRDFGYQQETDAYNRYRTSMLDAQGRVAEYIANGGDPSGLDAETVRQSGYTEAELRQMREKYLSDAAAQTAAASAARTAKEYSSGTNDGDGSDGSGGGTTSDYLGRAYASGATDYGTALSYFLTSGVSSTAAKELATYYAETYYPQARGDQNPVEDAGKEPEPQFTNAQQGGNVYVSGYGWLTESELSYRIGKGDINTRQNMNGTYTYVPKGMSGGDYKGTEPTGTGTNSGSNTIGANDAIRFNYDEDEGIFTLNGNTFNSPEKFLYFLNNHKWTEAQKNYIVQKVLPYIPDMTAKAR